MARTKDEEKDDDFFKEIYGKEYTGPPKPSREKDNPKKRPAIANAPAAGTAGSDEDNESRDPNAIPTDFTSREAKVWEAKAKAIEKNWKRKKEEEHICRICGDPGHFTQGCPTTIGGSRKSTEISERIPVKDKRLKVKLSDSTLHSIEKDTGCRLRLEDNVTAGNGSFFVCITGADRLVVRKAVVALKKIVDQVDDDNKHHNLRNAQDPSSDANPLIAAQSDHIPMQRMHQNPNIQAYNGRADSDQHMLDTISSQGGSGRPWESGIKTEADAASSFGLKRGEFALGAGTLASSQDMKGPSQEETYYGIGTEGRTSERSFKLKEQDMELAYEQRLSMPRTLEELEYRFMQEMMALTKEQNEAEDKENIRHREMLREIQEQYQQKMTTLRAQQAKYREEFLWREAQLRQQQYQQAANRSSYDYSSSTQLSDLRGRPRDLLGYGSAIDSHHGYGSGYLSYKDREQHLHSYDRNPGYDSGSIYPGKQGYDIGRYPPY